MLVELRFKITRTIKMKKLTLLRIFEKRLFIIDNNQNISFIKDTYLTI